MRCNVLVLFADFRWIKYKNVIEIKYRNLQCCIFYVSGCESISFSFLFLLNCEETNEDYAFLTFLTTFAYLRLACWLALSTSSQLVGPLASGACWMVALPTPSSTSSSSLRGLEVHPPITLLATWCCRWSVGADRWSQRKHRLCRQLVKALQWKNGNLGIKN